MGRWDFLLLCDENEDVKISIQIKYTNTSFVVLYFPWNKVK